jgi:hypothetical protein
MLNLNEDLVQMVKISICSYEFKAKQGAVDAIQRSFLPIFLGVSKE